MQSTTQFRPKKGCSHAYTMIYEVGFCCCTREGCEQKWVMTEFGWRAVPDHWRDGMDVEQTNSGPSSDPYQKFRRSGGPKRESGARLRPKVKNNMRKSRFGNLGT